MSFLLCTLAPGGNFFSVLISSVGISFHNTGHWSNQILFLFNIILEQYIAENRVLKDSVDIPPSPGDIPRKFSHDFSRGIVWVFEYWGRRCRTYGQGGKPNNEIFVFRIVVEVVEAFNQRSGGDAPRYVTPIRLPKL